LLFSFNLFEYISHPGRITHWHTIYIEELHHQFMRKERFCPQCGCAFPAWVGTCPHCKVQLVEELLPQSETVEESISYETLVNVVRKDGGQVKIDLETTDVGRRRSWRVPFRGHGYAWARKMTGSYGDISVDLKAIDVGMEEKWIFPYFGHGFGWVRKMGGYIGGNEVLLTATKVEMEKKWRFPYLGYGYAWTQEMSGNCGNQLKAELATTEVGKERKYRFPYFGYGYAWMKKGVLTLTLEK
jgi:hypothetical protein